MSAREYTTDDPHGECEHNDTREARVECDRERDETRAETVLARRQWIYEDDETTGLAGYGDGKGEDGRQQ